MEQQSVAKVLEAQFGLDLKGLSYKRAFLNTTS